MATEDSTDKSKRDILRYAVGKFSLDPFGIHGLFHWYNVFTNCLALHPSPTTDEEHFFWCFAMLHDCERKNDGPDLNHGLRASLALPKDTDFQKLLVHAIENHGNGQVTGLPLVGVCWDADRLELPRVGVTPSEDFMSTTAGEEYIKKMVPPPIKNTPKIIMPNRGIIV